jgi:amino acid adenylation domain-containing protein/non-ribosomal peptide synthase protein (TIGR01720 family)
MLTEDVAIIGISGIYPDCDDLRGFYGNLRAGLDSVRQISARRRADLGLDPSAECQMIASLERADEFDHEFFGLSLREAEHMDPHQRWLLQLSCAAVENAGYRLSQLRGASVAVVFSACHSAYAELIAGPDPDPTAITGNLSAALAGRVSYALDLRGPALVVDTACSSSLVAVYEACKQLYLREAEWALAGGVNFFFAEDRFGSSSIGIVAPDGRSKAFDAGADGAGWGEGGGVVLLKLLSRAQADGDHVHAVIKGGAVNQDGGRSNGLAAPSPHAQAELIASAWEKARVDPLTVSYIEAHGTGTQLGDPIEIQGIADAFRRHTDRRGFCAVGSLKTNIGHLTGAAGVAGLTKVVLSLRHRQLLPSIHFERPNPFIDFAASPVYVNAKLSEWRAESPLRAGLSSFGLSGTNAHLVLEEAPPAPPPAAGEGGEAVVLTLSAKTRAALEDYLRSLSEYLGDTDEELPDIAYTLNRGRDAYAHRFAAVAASKEELAACVARALDGAAGETAAPAGRPVVFLCSGDAPGVDSEAGRSLYERHAQYRAAVEECRAALAGGAATEQFGRFAHLYALYRLWESLGLSTRHVLGTGVGNVVVGVVTGRLTLPEGVARAAGFETAAAGVDREKLKGVLGGLPLNPRPAFLELGGEGTLSREIGALRGELGELSIINPDDAWAGGPVLDALSALYLSGVNVDWDQFYGGESRRRVECPTYPFRRTRCWVGAPARRGTQAESAAQTAAAPAPALGNVREADATPEQRRLGAIWGEVLKLEELGLDDDFFDLGGSSLNEIRLVGRVEKEFGLKLDFNEVYDYTTIRSLSARIAELGGVTSDAACDSEESGAAVHSDGSRTPGVEAPGVAPAEAVVSLPLSHGQQRLWVIDQQDPGSPVYNVPTDVRLRGALDAATLERCLREVVRRHDVLRTTFVNEGDAPRQLIAPRAEVSLPLIDLSALPDHEREARAAHLAVEESRAPFDLGRGPLFRVRLVRLGAREHLLLLTMHHIISDGWSSGVLIRELSALYNAYTAGHAPPLAPLPMQYGDFAGWEREWLAGRDLDADVAYWKEQLAGSAEVVELPTDRPRPPVQSFRGARQYLRLSRGLTDALKGFCKARGVTPYMVLLAGFQSLLHRYSGQSDIAVGTPVANRHRAETEPLIGFFVNTLVLRTDLSGDPTFSELLGRVKRVALGAYAHQALPFDRVVEELRPVRKQSHAPFFQHIFVLQNTPSESDLIPGLSVEPFEVDRGTSMFDMTVTLGEGAGQINGWWEYSTDLFDHSTVERMIGHYERLLEAALADPERRLWEIPLLSEAERARLLEGARGEAKEFPRDATFPRLFEAQVERTPDTTAVRCGGEAVTYAELNRRANRLAHRLRRLGAGADTLVALCVERSTEMLVGLLGVLKSGAAYLPLDASYPKERLRHVVEDSGAAFVLTRGRLLERVRDFGAPAVCLDDADIGLEESANPAGAAEPESLAYVIYTSGSTGRPKGVMVPHRGLVNYLWWGTEAYEVAAGDGAPVHSSLGFDLTVTGLLPPLLAGRAVTLVEEGEGVEALAEAIRVGDNFSLIKITPSHLEALNRRLAPAEMAGKARALVIGGEALAAETLEPWRRHAPGTRLINEYGPTETVVGCCVHEVSADGAPAGAVPIGRPIANTQLYVLDARGGLAPAGVHGELYIGGSGVARGYLNRPALTAERFVPDPFSDEPGARLYKTGDRVRLLPDGGLEFLGRGDAQLKIRGFRVEPGEIEATLLRHESVREAAVVAVGDEAARARLVAFVSHADGARPSADELKDWLREYVPEYMVPASFNTLASLPLTTNGKVDRRALAEAAKERPVSEAAGAEPRTPVEATLARIWADVLGLERVGVHDNFYELGGDSIINIQVIARAKREGLHFTPRQLLQHQTVAELASVLSVRQAESPQPAAAATPPPSDARRRTPSDFPLAALDAPSLERLNGGDPNVEDIYRLTPTQSGMLFHTLSEPGVYVEQLSWELHGPLDREALAGAWQKVVDRHTALRTSFDWEAAAEPVQIVRRRVPVRLDALDWGGASEDEVGRRLHQFLASDRARGFELSAAPLMRLTLIRLGEGRHRFVWTHHHLLLDGWSMPVILKEVFAFYDALSAGRELQLESPRPYRDYVAWSAAQDLAGAESFWRARLGDFDSPTPLPGAQAAPADAAHAPAEVSRRVPDATAAALRELARRTHLTLGTMLHGAWALLLSRHAGSEEVLFGSTVAGRPADLPGVDSMVGLFINTLPVRVRVAPEERLLPWLGRLHEEQAEARQYEHAPLRLIQSWSGVGGGSPLFESALVVENYPVGGALHERASGAGAETRVSGLVAREQTNYPLTMIVEAGAELTLKALYDPSRVEAWAAGRMLGHFERLLGAMAADPARRLSELDALGADERRQLLEEWNDTRRDYPTDACLHQLFEEQAARTPDAPALVYEGERLSYRELNERANRLAHLLRGMGVGPESRVGVLLERSTEMVVALLGALKAGGAYVPLDPSYPAERLRFMLEDARVGVLLTQQNLVGLAEGANRVLVLDDGRVLTEGGAVGNVESGVAEENLAYVIYTSGSTGRPKGAMNTHRAIRNRLLWMQEEYGLTESDRVLQKTPFSFDVSVWEFFWPLMTGACLVVARPGGHQDTDYLVEVITRHEITTLHFVPSMLQVFLEEPGAGRCASLTRVICSGEALPFELQERFFARLPAELHNLYGPTEAAVDVTNWACERGGARQFVPIGRPIANIRIYLLDGRMNPAPAGAAGELHIGGVGLARGYLNRPALTAERFVPDPFASEPGARLYKTGDLARYLPDGSIKYLGRVDHQVKIRGFRIELGEIESALGRHPELQETVVVTVREDAPGDRRLVAYASPSGATAPGVRELRAYLKDCLPEYMIPSAFVMLDALPLSPNGKVDRKALPAPEQSREALAEEFVAPREGAEEVLARIWSEVLGVERVGVHDNLFELGGDSILSLQVTARARQAGLQLTPRQVFEHPTVAELAALASAAPAALAAQGEVTGPLPLTPVQHWFFEQNLARPHHWNQSLLFEVREPMDAARLRDAVARLVTHHDALRLRFARGESGWEQSNAPAGAPAPFAHVDLSGLPEQARPAALERAADAVQAGLDLRAGPLMRVALFDLGASRPARLLFVIHHLAVDGVSWRVLLEDLLTAYRQLAEGRPVDLGQKTTSYQQWAGRLGEYAQTRDVKDEADYWSRELSGSDAPLPVDFVNGANTVGSAREVSVSLEREETRALLRDLPAVYGTQINDALLTALARAFSRWAEAGTLLVDVEGHGREDLFDDVDLTRTVGWFTSIYPFPLRLREAAQTEDALARTKRRLRAVPRNGVGYGLLRYLCADPAVAARFNALPRAEVSFNYLGQFDQTLESEGGLALAQESGGRARDADDARPHLLDVNCVVTGGCLRVTWTYSENFHARRTVESLARDFLEGLRSLHESSAWPDAQTDVPSDFTLSNLSGQKLHKLLDSVAFEGME